MLTFAFLLVCLALGAGATPAAAQQPAPMLDEAGASAFLPAEHWMRGALVRLGGAGLIDLREAVGAWPIRRSRARALLAAAERYALALDDAAAADLARAYSDRLDHEFPERDGAGGIARWRAEAGVGAVAGEGELVAGRNEWVDGVGWVYAGPRPAAGPSGPRARTGVDAVVRDRLAVRLAMRRSDRGTTAPEAYAAVGLGPVDLWLGRRGLGLGGTTADGIVLSDRSTFTGAGLSTPAGGRLPGLLSAAGPVRGTLVVARMQRSGTYRHPWFAAARIDVAPRPGLVIGLNRATLFGGAGNEPVTAGRVLMMSIGLTDVAGKDSDFENQVASVDFAWRIRPGGVPLVVYGEWGFDDIGFAWTNVPGIIAGIDAPSLPGLSALGLNAEYVRFAGSCCGNPPWYHHGALAEGWTDRGSPLGHSLGGHGSQSSLRARLAPSRAPFLVDLRAFARRRGAENLFSPDRAGTSRGGELELVLFGPFGASLRAEGAIERFEHGVSAWSAGIALDFSVGGARRR